MKRPSFQFYPSDWLRDTALRSCSIGARGLWIDLICYMHEGAPYGHLKVNDKVILPANLARMVGETLDVVEGWLSELADAGVFQYDDDGSIFSKRMVRDEELRNKRASGGVLGGNPNLINKDKVKGKVNHKVANKVKQNTTPSSSSSSSSSSFTKQEPIKESATKVAKPKASILKNDWELPDEWAIWAKKERPDLNINQVADGFKDYWISEAKAKADWFATWRYWIRKQRAEKQDKIYEAPWQKAARLRMAEFAPGVAAKDPNAATVIDMEYFTRPQEIKNVTSNSSD